MEKVVHTLEAFEAEAKRFAALLTPHSESATLITLSGELGAGKTAFTKAVAHTLGVKEVVTSPTFVLEKIYTLPPLGGEASKFERLVHIDAYRLKDGSELAPLDFATLIQDPANLILLEWPERVADALPTPGHHLSFVVHPDGSRTISYG